MDGRTPIRNRLGCKITMIERILKKWANFLNTYTDIELHTKQSLIISLLLVIVGLVLTICLLSQPERIPGT